MYVHTYVCTYYVHASVALGLLGSVRTYIRTYVHEYCLIEFAFTRNKTIVLGVATQGIPRGMVCRLLMSLPLATGGPPQKSTNHPNVAYLIGSYVATQYWVLAVLVLHFCHL